MGTDRTGPWWYSGPRDGTDGDAAEHAAADRAAVGLAGLIDGAQRLVGWAAQTVLTPHAQHASPAEHPACVLCQASTLFADAPSVLERLAARSQPDGPEPTGDPSIRWLPVRDER